MFALPKLRQANGVSPRANRMSGRSRLTILQEIHTEAVADEAVKAEMETTLEEGGEEEGEEEEATTTLVDAG